MPSRTRFVGINRPALFQIQILMETTKIKYPLWKIDLWFLAISRKIDFWITLRLTIKYDILLDLKKDIKNYSLKMKYWKLTPILQTELTCVGCNLHQNGCKLLKNLVFSRFLNFEISQNVKLVSETISTSLITCF